MTDHIKLLALSAIELIKTAMQQYPKQATILIGAAILLLIIKLSPSGKKKRNKRKRTSLFTRLRIRRLASGQKALSPDQFFKLRKKVMENKKDLSRNNFPGVYIINNKSKKEYYVGQAEKIFNRVNQHFSGHGNGDVYADYKNGDKFVIRLMPLAGSGFRSLNELERHTIITYHAYRNGYNRTGGNHD